MKRVTLKTFHMNEMAAFYSSVLLLPILEQTAERFCVKAGTTAVCFEKSSSPAFYHAAFAIASDSFAQCYARLQEQGCLLRDSDGEELFTSPTWQREQIYFEDPDGNIMEVLAIALPEKGEQQDGRGLAWLRLQEVGMPSPDLSVLASSFTGITNQFSAESESFRFYGDREGVFVLVKEGRPWFPTDRPATIHLELEGEKGDIINVFVGGDANDSRSV